MYASEVSGKSVGGAVSLWLLCREQAAGQGRRPLQNLRVGDSLGGVREGRIHSVLCRF